MVRAAPRLSEKLRAEIARADDGSSAAEICRRAGAAAERLGVPRPSYEQVRVTLIDIRLRRRPVSGRDVLFDIAMGVRPATDFDAWLADTPLPYRPGAKNEPPDRRP